MKNNAPTFVIIGKPNNGKSSMISALTFNDMVEVSQSVGTTVVKSSYAYIRDNKIVCSFYDTPGFESAKDIYRYIKENRAETLSNHKLLRNYIREHKDEESRLKDIEILEAVLESDYIVFMVNVSEKFNKNNIGAELEIINFINKPTLVLFNQKSDENHEKEWEEALIKHNLYLFHKINPLEMNFTNIMNLYTKLNSVASIKNREFLESLKNTHNRHMQENVEESSAIIATMIKKVLHFEKEYKVKKEKITSDDKEKALQEYQAEIYKIERDAKEKMSKVWGYYQLQIKDTREEFDSQENIELGLSRQRLLFLGVATGAGTAATLTAPTSMFDMGLTTAISSTVGATLGGVGAYLLGEKFHSVVISKKKIIYKVDKKAFNVTIILLKRALEYLYRLIQHGHANRADIIIPKKEHELKFNAEWSFSKNDIKNIIKIHRYIVKDEDTKKYVDELSELIQKLVYTEVIKI
jgi:GTP-binding protein EngB required for normal cell division